MFMIISLMPRSRNLLWSSPPMTLVLIAMYTAAVTRYGRYALHLLKMARPWLENSYAGIKSTRTMAVSFVRSARKKASREIGSILFVPSSA